MSAAREQLETIRRRMATAAAQSGRSVDEIRLIAVSKTQPVTAIQTLVDLGIRDFGENRIQEAQGKIEYFRNNGLNWHFIGHLQANKTRHIPGNFGWVHTIDSVKLAGRLSAAMAQHGSQPIRVLLQVNVAADPAKHGLLADELYPTVDTLMQQALPGIDLCGLMTLGFQGATEGETRASFATLRELLAGCRQRFGDSFGELSMGMSGDFEIAIEEGATLVRVGTALFGRRSPP